MATRLTFLVTAAVAAGLISLAPQLAMAPGPLVPGHAALTGDCLACHTPFAGLPEGKCVGCHPLAQIGADAGKSTAALGPFHVALEAKSCTRCHPEHARRGKGAGFAHEALEPGLRGACETCHQRPTDDLHEQLADGCAACHVVTSWKGATFDHARVAQRACAGCHEKRRPADELHAGAGDDCAGCHGTRAWTPATFEHATFFVLDRDHQAPCRTCHEGPGYRTYTCYGCHEHTPAEMEREHVKEGIRDFQDCVRCHRSGEEGEGREGGKHDDRRRREGGKRGDREHHEGREHGD